MPRRSAERMQSSIRSLTLGCLSLLCLVAWVPAVMAEDEEGFKPIFNGKDLDGWDGNPDFWRVEDGAITGQTTPENPTRGNTFVIWRGGKPADFELKLQYRIVGGNSGIQYRSVEVPNLKWVISGYQADFEAGDTYSGILYEERGRGILARRGQKTVIGEDHKPQVVGSVGDSNEIQSKIKKEEWNDYHIIAKGNHLIHKINGVTTVEVIDEDEERRRDAGLIALQLHTGPPMLVQFRNIRLKTLNGGETTAKARNASKRIAFVAGNRSHGYGAHEHKAGCLLLAKCLEEALPGVQTVVYTGGWPKDPNAFEGFDAIVMYSDGGGGHMVNRNLEQVEQLMKRGVGLACIHYAVEVPKGESGERFLDWIGGYFETNWSVNPHWTAHFKQLPEHPVTRGVKPFSINDEWYYHMRFRENMDGVTPILSDLPGESTLTRPDGPHSGNPHVRAAVANGERQHVAWVRERPDGGRGFGFTGGHNHWNWGHNDFRKLVLNAIVWVAGGDVPTDGVPTKPLTLADLQANQDFDPPANFNKDRIENMLKEWNSRTVSAK